jgi:pilus assembly protein CpaB
MIRSANAMPNLNRRNITFAIAAVLALGTGWLTFTYLASVNRGAATVAATRILVVAQRDIPARATITPDMLALARRPADTVDSDSISATGAVVGSIARVTIPAGSAVTMSKIGRAFDPGLTQRIEPGMRAIAIPIDKVKGVANLIQAGDHVDVIALTRAAPGVPPQALTILKNKVVLAMGSSYETVANNASPSPDATVSTATLEVTPKEADLLALADVNTTLRLDLREPKERTGSQAPDTLVLAVPPVQSLGRPSVPAAAPRAAAPAPVHHNAVEIIDGDTIDQHR